MEKLKVLLVNPPIYDFTAYDFWLRPYGMLRVAGHMRRSCDIYFFDYLVAIDPDHCGRGAFPKQEIQKPEILRDIPRRFYRFGRKRAEFRDFLRAQAFDLILVQTVMTYWYLGIREVLEDLREIQPGAKIVLGGVYATLCTGHAHTLGADLVVEGGDLEPLWQMAGIMPFKDAPYWEPGISRGVGILKITEGCPFRCTYCSVPVVAPDFFLRATDECLQELRNLLHRTRPLRDRGFRRST